MKTSGEQVLGSFALLAVTAMLMVASLPSQIPRDPATPDIPYAVEKPGTIAVELTGESGRNGVYFVPKGTTLSGFLDRTGITDASVTGDPKRVPALRFATKVTLSPIPPGIFTEPMTAQKRLALGIPIDINRSSLQDLVLVPGIGEKTAEKIVEQRSVNGMFRKLDELMLVQGIKEKRFEKLRKYFCIAC